MKIKEYENVWRKECTHLSSVVQEYIKNGWQPFGGVASTHVWDEKTKDLICWHGQAMVKYEEPEYYGFGTPPGNVEAQEELDKIESMDNRLDQVEGNLKCLTESYLKHIGQLTKESKERKVVDVHYCAHLNIKLSGELNALAQKGFELVSKEKFNDEYTLIKAVKYEQ